MKKLFFCIFIFLNQTNYNSYTPRTVRRQCHLRHTDQDFNKDLGNSHLREALASIRNQRYLNQSHISRYQPTSSRRPQLPDPELSSVLIIRSILPDIYHPPKISRWEILPKK